MKDERQSIKVVGLCVARIQEDYEANMVLAISRELKRRGMKVIVFNSFSDLFVKNEYIDGESTIFKLIHSERVDALVVLSESIKNDEVSKEIVKFANDNDIPIVSVERCMEGCINIQFDYENAFREIVEHVISVHNCRTVNLIAGIEGNEFSEARLNIYKEVLESHDIPYDESRVGYGNFWTVPTRAVMERFLSDERGLPEAIVCCNDTMALTACQILQERGYNIPKDIIVTGFDGIEMEKYATPRLTTAVTDFEALGIGVCDSLMKYKKDGLQDEVRKIEFKVRIAQSCGCKEIGSYDAFNKISTLCEKMLTSRGHEAFMHSYTYDSLECKLYQDIAKTAARHAENLNVWICLNYDYFRDVELSPKYNGIYANEMVLLFHAKNAELLSFCEEYQLRDYLPNLEQAYEDNDLLIFSPIHYQDETYGYSVVGISTEDSGFEFVHRYLNATSQILENVRKNRILKAAYVELEEMNLRDSLTGLYNRRGYEKKCMELVERCTDDKELLVVSIDLDNLKYINDHFGHDKGDIAITSAADILNSYLDKDVVCARFGGDEYVLVLASESASEQEHSLMNYIDKELTAFNERGYEFELVMSVGYASVKNATMKNIYEALKIADSKMYDQKRQHKQQ